MSLRHSLEILGLTMHSTVEEVKAAHRALAFATHPDQGGTVEEFHIVQAAYKEALAYAESAPCRACEGSGKQKITKGFTTLAMPCKVCGGSGKRG